jgi:membrane protease subunit HflC
MKKSTLLLLTAVFVAALLGPTAVYTIRETEVGVVTRFGRPLDALAEPGLHVKWPWPVDAVVRVDRRLLVFDNEPAEMLTRDKKNVLVDSFLCWRIADPLRFVQTVGSRPEAEARLLDLTASELGAAVGSQPMDSFLNADPERVKLRAVADEARGQVHDLALASFGIEVVDLEINGFNLPRQNRQSVIERMRAERATIATRYRSEGEEEALKIEALSAAEREKILAEARAEAEAVRGRGEADALELLGAAYRQDPEFYRFLRSLESYEKIIDENTTLFIESDSQLMEALNGG